MFTLKTLTYMAYLYTQFIIHVHNHWDCYTFLYMYMCIENNHYVTLLDDWRCDGYRWRNQGVCKLPRKLTKVKKMYFDIDAPNGASREFQRHAYQLVEESSLTLLHYIGNETAAVDFAHQNTRTLHDQPFVRTCPSAIQRLKEACKSAKANVVYKKEIGSMTCDPALVKAKTPRNMKQLRNLRYQHLHRSRVSHDALYKLHELTYDVPGFVWKITTYPDLICILGSPRNPRRNG